MYKTIAFIFVATFFLKSNAVKLHGHEFETSAEVLHTALNRINDLKGDVYSSHRIDAAYKFIPNEVYTYVVSVSDLKDDIKNCLITISYAYSEINALVTIKCEGETEEIKQIINEMN